jgi:hypothetical protein
VLDHLRPGDAAVLVLEEHHQRVLEADEAAGIGDHLYVFRGPRVIRAEGFVVRRELDGFHEMETRFVLARDDEDRGARLR